MSSNATNFEQLFVHRGIHTGKQTAFSLSPKGNRLLSATDTGSLVLIDTRLGHMQARIDTTNRFTALAWVSETQAIVAGDEGIIFNVLLHYATMNSLPVVSMAYIHQDLRQSVRTLAYDIGSQTLALGYQSGVSIWRLSGKKFILLDRVHIQCEGSLSADVNTVQFFGKPEQRIFAGGCFGYFIWFEPGQVVFNMSGPKIDRIGNSAVSPNGQLLSLSTLDHGIKILPLMSNGPSTHVEGAHYTISTGREYVKLEPRTPLAITKSGFTISGSQVGQLAVLSPNGELIHDFFFEYNLLVRGIQTCNDRIYVSFNGPAGGVTIVGYSTCSTQAQTFEKLRYASQDKLSKLVNVRIDLKEVLKVSPGYRRQQHKQLDEVVPQPQSRGCGFPLALFLFAFITVVLAIMPPQTWMRNCVERLVVEIAERVGHLRIADMILLLAL